MPYKVIIDRWLWPDVLTNQVISIAKAKKAITDYKKAAREPEGIFELMAFYCEQAIGFANSIGFQDEVYFDALVRMFEQTLKQLPEIPERLQQVQRERLSRIAGETRDLGYGVFDDLDGLLSNYQPSEYGREKGNRTLANHLDGNVGQRLYGCRGAGPHYHS